MWNREPAPVAGLVQGSSALPVAVGLDPAPEQLAALVGATRSVPGVGVRRTVTPARRVGAPLWDLAEVA